MTGPQRLRLAAQPWLGLGGLLLTAVVFLVLALGTGSAATGYRVRELPIAIEHLLAHLPGTSTAAAGG